MAGGEASIIAKLVAEFVGTFMLIFTIGCNVITGQPVWGGVSIACVLMVMVYALGKSSGGSFNPAVSLALALHGDLPWAEFGMYVVVETLAGIIAGCTYVAMLGKSFNLEPTPGHAAWQACMAEVIYTFMLCFVVLNVACSKKHAGKEQFYGLAIGFVIVAGAYSGGGVSMGCFNPAVAFGIDVSSIMHGFGYSIVYTVCEMIGAVIAYGCLVVCRPEEMGSELGPEGYGVASKLLSEFLGTYMLVLTVGLNVLNGSAAAVFSIAASLMCMIFALGSCSGAHFNPAVTVAIVCSRRGKCAPADAGMYIPVQIVGGVAACGTYMAMKGSSFPLGPGTGYVLAQALIAEFIFTFVLSFVVLSTATVKQGLSEFFGLAIGSCVTVGGYAIGKISGGSLNPAVSFGIASFGGGYVNAVAYAVIEILAGAFAAAVFQATQPSEFDTETKEEGETGEKESIAADAEQATKYEATETAS